MTRIKEDIQKIRKILYEDGPQSWGQLMKKTGLTVSVLKDRIDLMIKRNEVSTISGREGGRRKTLYGLANKEKTKGEIDRFKALKFIESLTNPVYNAYETKDEKKSLSTFLASIPNNKRDEAQQKADKITKLASKVFKVIGTGLPRGQKVAVILTVEG
jgi:predicted ArsR family transcriptional regulator